MRRPPAGRSLCRGPVPVSYTHLSNISITNDGAIRVEESRKVIFEGPHVHMAVSYTHLVDEGFDVFREAGPAVAQPRVEEVA